MSDSVSRSWFAVLNNPEQHGFNGTPAEIIEKLKQLWIADNPTIKKGFWAYCISATGTPHIHMILEGAGSMRFSKVRKTYGKAIHLEPTKGSRKSVLAYIKKEPPYDEKGEKVIATTEHNNIAGFKKLNLNTHDEVLYAIEQLIEDGLTPFTIMEQDIKFRKEEALIKKAYYAKRYKETPPIRKVKTIWHTGPSGSGKSYTYIKLCEEFGDDNVYFFSDYANKGVGGFDGYMGEKILFIDELKKGALPYEMLLIILDCYRTQIHCRFNNAYALWEEVHITSIFSPEEIYKSLVKKELQKQDTVEQLLRRISLFVYHYKEYDEYKTVEITNDKYKGYADLINNIKTTQLCINDYPGENNNEI